MKTFTFFILAIISGPLLASNLERGRIDNYETIIQRRFEKYKEQPKELTQDFIGRIQCANDSHLKTNSCKLEFVSTSGKIFELRENEFLENQHCLNHKDLIVTMTAVKQPQFLFWGGDLIVLGFSIIEEVEPIKNNSKNKNTIEKFERLNFREKV